MKRLVKRVLVSEKGFSMVELAVVLAIMSVLAAIAVPNLTGFLSKGAEQSYNADVDALETAVDSYRTEATGAGYPTLNAVQGTSAGDCPTGDGDSVPSGIDDCPWIDIGQLATDGYLKSDGAVESADSTKNETATSSGSYGYYIDQNGEVQSDPVFDTEDAVYP